MKNRIRNSILLFNELKKYITSDATRYFEHKSALRNYLLENNLSIHPDIANSIDPLKLGQFSRDVFQLLNNSSHPPGHSRRVTETIDRIIGELEFISPHLSEIVLFYSWQSDLPHRSNRNYINSAITKACKISEEELHIKITIDKDTLNIPGSPDIINTIREKIENSTIFVADITPIISLNSKLIPNPNVLIELGYAWKSLGNDNILMVMNTAYGSLRGLPFDLGFKRQITYDFKSDAPEKPPIKPLIENLKAKISGIIRNHIG